MTDDAYFFDSYAIIEILSGNPCYDAYKDVRIVTTKLNIFEVVSGILREKKVHDAEAFLDSSFRFIVDYDAITIRDAAILWVQYRKQNLSMTDCIGYCLALKLGVKFLTGDKEFEHMPNVEFVK